jgi:TRAP-type C4-dicarboxylate transport system permease small subunit
MMALILMVLILLIQIVLRQINISVPWMDELATYMNYWIVYFGAAIVLHEHMHVDVDFVETLLSGKKRVAINVAAQIVQTLVALAFIVSALRLIINLPNLVTQTLKMPYRYIFGISLTGFCLMLLQSVYDLFRIIHGKEYRTT